jgi:hypothetical protein
LILFLDQCEMTHRALDAVLYEACKMGNYSVFFCQVPGGRRVGLRGSRSDLVLGMLGVSGGARLNE